MPSSDHCEHCTQVVHIYIYIQTYIHARKINKPLKNPHKGLRACGSMAELCLEYRAPGSTLSTMGDGRTLTTLRNSQWGVLRDTPMYFWLSVSSMLPQIPCSAYTHLSAVWLWFPSSNPVPSLVASDCFVFQGRDWACPRCTEKDLGLP